MEASRGKYLCFDYSLLCTVQNIDMNMKQLISCQINYKNILERNTTKPFLKEY